MMKTLILSQRILRKRGKSTIFLMIEMVLALMILVGISSKMMYMKESSEIANTFKNTDIWYFTPASYYSPDFRLEHVVDEEICGHVEIGSVTQIVLKTRDDISIDCLGYSDLILEHIHLKLNDGDYFISDSENYFIGDSGEYVQAIATAESYSVGDIIDLTNGQKIKIIGTMDIGSYCITCHGSGNSGNSSLEHFAAKIEKATLIIPWESDRYQNVDADNVADTIKAGSEFIKIKEDDFEEQIVKELQNYGSISYIEEMEANYRMDNHQFFITNSVILAVMTILLTIGIAGINGIQSEKNSKDYSIYYICGMSRRKNMYMEIMNTLLPGGITYLCFWWIYSMFGTEIFGEQVSLKWYTSLIVTGYIVAVYFVSSISFILKSGKADIAELYKRG